MNISKNERSTHKKQLVKHYSKALKGRNISKMGAAHRNKMGTAHHTDTKKTTLLLSL